MIAKEIDYFYNGLGIPSAYFKTFTPTQIAKHIHAFIAAKKIAEIGGLGENIDFNMQRKHSTLYLGTKANANEMRQKIEKRIGKLSTDYAIDLTYVKSTGTIQTGGKVNLLLVSGNRTAYESPTATESDDVHLVATSEFIKNLPKDAVRAHGRIISRCMNSPHPQMLKETVIHEDGSSNSRLLFAIRSGRAPGLKHQTSLFEILDLCDDAGIDTNKAYHNTFANGVSVYAVYTSDVISEEKWKTIRTKVNLTFNLPEHTFLDGMRRSGQINVGEKFYLFSAAQFALYFSMYQWNEDFENLHKKLEGNASK